MVRALARRCSAIAGSGQSCDATPMRDQEFCFWHHPEHQEAAAEARRLGGVRRKREGAVAGAYELDGLATVPELRRLLEIAAFDALALDNSVARVRAITAIVQVGAKLLEVSEFERRLASLEDVLKSRQPQAAGWRR